MADNLEQLLRDSIDMVQRQKAVEHWGMDGQPTTPFRHGFTVKDKIHDALLRRVDPAYRKEAEAIEQHMRDIVNGRTVDQDSINSKIGSAIGFADNAVELHLMRKEATQRMGERLTRGIRKRMHL